MRRRGRDVSAAVAAAMAVRRRWKITAVSHFSAWRDVDVDGQRRESFRPDLDAVRASGQGGNRTRQRTDAAGSTPRPHRCRHIESPVGHGAVHREGSSRT